jgi:hypothetical protein
MSGGIRIRIPMLEEFAIQARDLLSHSARSLNPEEKRLLLTIFGSSINLEMVQIVATEVGSKGRPYTLGTTIRIPDGTYFDAPTLVHEMTHVWQYQTQGTRYISDSVLHQLTTDAYAVKLVPGQSFRDYTAEQQAMIVQHYYEKYPVGWNVDPDVVRMIGEVRCARPLSASQIQQETWFGPNRNMLENTVPPGVQKPPPQTVPLIRIEF